MMMMMEKIVRVNILSTDQQLKNTFAELLRTKLEKTGKKTLILNSNLNFEKVENFNDTEKACWSQMGVIKGYSLNYEDVTKVKDVNIVIDVTPLETIQMYNSFLLFYKVIEDENTIDNYEKENLLQKSNFEDIYVYIMNPLNFYQDSRILTNLNKNVILHNLNLLQTSHFRANTKDKIQFKTMFASDFELGKIMELISKFFYKETNNVFPKDTKISTKSNFNEKPSLNYKSFFYRPNDTTCGPGKKT